MVSHFLFEAEFCNPASGWEKGQVEKNVRDARHRLWQVVPPFPSLLDGKPAPAPVTSPQALKLAVEPQANVLRYDQLREVRYAS